jgi:hypothetical protein
MQAQSINPHQTGNNKPTGGTRRNPVSSKTSGIRFLKHYVTNGVVKARVWYSLDNRIDGRKCVTLYAKDYSRELGPVFADEYINETDTMTDYFERGRVVLFEGHPHYAAARERAEANDAAWQAKWAKKHQA